MKKRTILTIIGVLFVLGLCAQPISELEALQKAQRFLQGKNILSPSGKSCTRGVKENPFKHLYLFNVEDNGGFVIVAGDSRAREILGYSDTGNLDYSKMPDNMKWWLSIYDQSIASIPADMTESQTRADENKPDVAPMMSFSWDQIAPYNYYCPSGTLTGCVPLAMAQMMAFHKYPNNLPALEGYTDDNGNKLDALQANYIDYDNMSTYDPALLARYCGQAVQANYDYGATAAYAGKIPLALANQFGFDKGVHNAFRRSYNSTEWDDLLYNELKSGRPFILGGQEGGNMGSGHSFICHGYSEGYYAVNWGYGGRENGYFAMTNLTVSGHNYSTELIATVGICPPKDNKRDFPIFSICKMEVVSPLVVNRSSSSADFTDINISWLIESNLLEDTDCQVGLALFKPDGSVDLMVAYNPLTMKPGLNASAEKTLSIPSKYGDGIYRINIIYIRPDDTTWNYCQGNYWRYIQAVISGNTLTLTNYPDYDGPYPTGPYPPYYPVNPDNPDNPDDPDNPDNPDETKWPEANISIDYPVMKVQYAGYIETETDWSTLSDLIQSKLGITATAFDNYYWADCFDDENGVAVPAEDASYVTPYAYNYNSEGGYKNNWYDLKLFNFGSDIYGNGGTPPVSGKEGEEAEPEWDYVALAAYAPNKESKGNHVISYELPDDVLQSMTANQTSPLNFTRWVRFVAKPDAEGKVEAPYRYVWLKLQMAISWGGDSPDGINTVGTDKPTGCYYNLRGQRMNHPNSLPKGVYIFNGRKILK